MEIEYEATFLNINKNEMREKFKKAGAKLLREEFLQKRVTFSLPKEKRSKGKWARVRNEGDKITLSFKNIDGDKIHNQREICLKVNSFDEAVEFLLELGCEKKSYQETKRELWKLDDVELTIDEWPFLEPFVEIEGESEKAVQDACKKIGFDYSKALFCAVGELYKRKYGIHLDYINNKVSRITFNSKNPFLKNS